MSNQQKSPPRGQAHLRFGGEFNDRITAFAKRENRSLANAILFLAKQKLDELEAGDAVYATTALRMQPTDTRPD